MALHIDLLQHDDIVIAADFLEDAAELIGGVLVVTAKPFAIGVDDALGSGSSPAQAIRVFTASMAASRDGRFASASAGVRSFRISLMRNATVLGLRDGGRAGRVLGPCTAQRDTRT
jgi:hypothetical protein